MFLLYNIHVCVCGKYVWESAQNVLHSLATFQRERQIYNMLKMLFLMAANKSKFQEIAAS